MRGLQPDISVIHKRTSSRESLNFINVIDKDEPSGRLPSGGSKESWQRPFPHVMVAIISSFLCGYHLGVVNDTLESISIDLGFNGSTMAEGLVVSTCLAGALIGSMCSGWVADGFGRRRAFQLCALPIGIGSVISATSSTINGMLLGRLFVGVGIGIGPAIAALYVSEISPASIRGTYGSSTQIASCLGILSSLFIGIPAKDTMSWWRVCFWASIIPASLLAILMEFCAESPHWLYKRGRIAEAEKEVERLFGAHQVKSSMAELGKSDKADGGGAVTLFELLYGRHFRVVFIGAMLFAFQQLSGINAVFYFSSVVFKSAGVPSDIGNISVGVVNLLGSIVAMILMDKLGRKVLLFWSFVSMAAAMSLQVMAASSMVPRSGVVYLSVGGILMFVLTFSLGAGVVPGLLLSEIFPGRIKAKAMALCMGVHWVVNFFVGLLFLRLLEQLGPQILYTVFATFCVAAAFFVKKNVIETKGKTLQEIEMALLPVDD